MDPVADLLLDAAEAKPLVLLVRHEGVLAPAAVPPPPGLVALVRRVAARPGTRLHLISATAAAATAGWWAGTGAEVHDDGAIAVLPDRLRREADGARIVVIGTTAADEVLFRAIRPPHVTARVGSGATAAEARLEDWTTVQGLLSALL